MQIDETGHQQSSAAIEGGLDDRTRPDLGNLAILYPHRTALDDLVGKHEVKVAEPHALLLTPVRSKL
jgi:hypothetical protein